MRRLSRLNILVPLALLLLAACSAPRAVPQPPAAVLKPLPAPQQRGELRPDSAGRAVLASARQMLGTPYRYGGADPTGFDCSGLVNYAYRRAGIRVPRTSTEQFRQARPVALAQLRPGDILFFRLRPPKVSHVGLYAGNGRFIHAPSSGKRVTYASLDNPYWQRHLLAAGRF